MDVDERRSVECHRLLQHAGEVLGAGDREGLDAGSPCPGGKVWVIGLATGALVEGGPDLAAVEVGVLQIADRGPGDVVQHQPPHPHGVFDRGYTYAKPSGWGRRI